MRYNRDRYGLRCTRIPTGFSGCNRSSDLELEKCPQDTLNAKNYPADGKLPSGPGRYTGYLGFHADRAAGKYGRKKSGLLTIEPVAGTFPARVQSSGKIRKKF